MKPTHKMLAAALICTPLFLHPACAFSDTDGTWAEEPINFVTNAGLLNGISDYSFCPQLPVSRASFINALYEMAGKPPVKNDSAMPADVPADAAYTSAARWAAENGIIMGDFMPNKPLSREQLATLLNRFAILEKASVTLDGSRSVSNFQDANAMHAYSVKSMDWCVQAGLLFGLSDGNIHPTKSTTRAEAAAILQRYATLTNTQVGEAVQAEVIDEGEAFSTASGSTFRRFTRELIPEGALKERITYEDTSGGIVDMYRASARDELPEHIAGQYTLEGSSGTLRWYDSSTETWKEEPLASGAKPKGMYFIRTDSGAEAVLITPQSYADHDNAMVEHFPQYDGWLSIRQGGQGFTLSLTVPAQPSGIHTDLLAATSDTPLIDWDDPTAEERWANYNFMGNNRWLLSGYYYISPSSYYPYGPNYFYSLPAAHIMGKMLKNKDEPGSRILGLAMLDVMQRQQNDLGFIPSRAGSTWLLEDFNIPPGYYDSRFNTDFWLGCVNAYESFGAEKWLSAAKRYADFFVSFAEQHHYTFPKEGEEGWLVEDYWSPSGESLPTHTSLNHHAAEAGFLYRLSNALGEGAYAELADRMVLGIELTADKWVMPDSNLYYSYQPDGTMKEGDYPDLTYHDLVELQQLYSKRTGNESAAISGLIQSKYEWMKENGIA